MNPTVCLNLRYWCAAPVNNSVVLAALIHAPNPYVQPNPLLSYLHRGGRCSRKQQRMPQARKRTPPLFVLREPQLTGKSAGFETELSSLMPGCQLMS